MAGRRDRDLAVSVPQRQDGVVILAVLWICAIITWFALQIAAETRLKGEEQVLLLRRSQALHLAIGGAYEALGRMAQANASGLEHTDGHWRAGRIRHKGDRRDASDDNWQPDGEPRLVSYQTGQALVFIEDEGEKVNINKANHEQLRAVMEKAGWKGDTADTLADRILDFIDKDESIRLHGAEKGQYKSLGLPYGPFNGPLTSLDQMLLIPGITQQIFYGYGMKPEDHDEKDSDEPQVPALPTKYSLFRMLTVYGKNVNLKNEGKGLFDDRETKPASWKRDGIYRILSCGRSFHGPPTVLLWLIIRYAPDTPAGYEVLYRKTL